MDTYGTWLFALNIISIISSLFILLAYFCSDRIKTFGMKQICKLCFFDVLFSIGNLFLKDSLLDSSKNTTYCYVSFFLKFVGVEGSQMVTCLIAFLVCLSIRANGEVEKIKRIRRYSSFLTIVLILCSLSLTIVPMCLKAISHQGYYCYISSGDSEEVLLRLLIQFIPQFIYLFIMLYYSIYAYVKSHQKSGIVSKQFLLFPLAMVITQIPIIVERLYEIIGHNQPVNLWVDISYILLSLNGFINTLIYGLCTDIFVIIKENISQCCAGLFKKKSRNKSEQNNSYIHLNSNIQPYNLNASHSNIEDSLLTSKKANKNT